MLASYKAIFTSYRQATDKLQLSHCLAVSHEATSNYPNSTLPHPNFAIISAQMSFSADLLPICSHGDRAIWTNYRRHNGN